jgi:hypothetical protein
MPLIPNLNATHLIATMQAVSASAHWTDQRDQTPRLGVFVQDPNDRHRTIKVVAKGLAVTRCGAIRRGDRIEIEGTLDRQHHRIIASWLTNLGPPLRGITVPHWVLEPTTPAERDALLRELREQTRLRFGRFASPRQLGLLNDPRVLITGSRHWPRPWNGVVEQVLDRLLGRYHERLVVIEGRANGVDLVAHNWCLDHQLGPDRHRCYPVDWEAERLRRPNTWRQAGHDRNSQMLLQEQPNLVIAFHHRFEIHRGGTSNMCLKALLVGLPVWLTSSADPTIGCWLTLDQFPNRQVAGVRRDLAQWTATLHRQPFEILPARRAGITAGSLNPQTPTDTQRLISSGGIELPGSP